MGINALSEDYILKEDYRIIKSLGEGGFGITYLAEDKALGSKVVIKEFLPQSIATRDQTHNTVSPYTQGDEVFTHLLRRFEEEARLLAGLRHPNIVKVTRLIGENETAYFIMDYEEGETLEEFLEHSSALTEKEILEIILPILEGTKYVHGEGVLHRDIAPDNIYLKSTGMPMLIDFGAARNAIANESQNLSAIAKDGYSPPEQYTVNSDQNPATDIYALGAVMYRMITGHKPANAAHRQTAKLENHPDPIGNLVVNYEGKYSKSLLQAVTKALNISQSKRFQSIEVFQEAISKSLKETDTKNNKSLFMGIGLSLIIVMAVVFMKWDTLEGMIPESSAEPSMVSILDKNLSDTEIVIDKVKEKFEEKVEKEVEEILVLKTTSIRQKVKKKESQEELCNQGNYKECTNLAVKYVSGKKVKQDYFKAVELFTKACDNNHSKGCLNLGIMYQNGQGTRQNFLEAGKFYKKACEHKDAKACSNLGHLYEKGVGVIQNIKKAVALYTQACEGGITEGCSNLGYMYENGEGVDKNYTKALELYTKVCDNDDMIGCNNLAFMYENGQGTKVDTKKTVEFFRKACDGNMYESCSSLGYFYENGEGIKMNNSEAVVLYTKACDGENIEGCYNLAGMYQSGRGIGKSTSKAFKLYTKSCENGIPEGCSKVAYMYEKGDGIKVNKKKASQLYKKACEGKDASGCCSLGFIYENKKKISEAKKFYGKACDLGENLGCEGFTRLN